MLKVAAGTLLGVVLLVELVTLVGLIDLGSGVPREEVTMEDGSDNEIDKPVDQAVDESLDKATRSEENPGKKWCESEAGVRLTQLQPAYNSVTGSPQKVNKLQDTVIALGEDAPPGAYCVSTTIDRFIHFWNVAASDPEARRYDPAEQVKHLRAFVREGHFKRPDRS